MNPKRQPPTFFCDQTSELEQLNVAKTTVVFHLVISASRPRPRPRPRPHPHPLY